MTSIQREHYGPRLKEMRLTMKLTLQEFYGPITTHVNNFSPIENGNRKIGKRLSDELISYYRINETWLSTGKGKMLMEEVSTESESTAKRDNNVGVPFINISPAEISSGTFNILQEKVEYYVNFRPFNDCDAYLPIYGDSMYPKYASGEIIAVREVTNKEIIQWGEAYLVITDDFANNLTTVKLLFEHPSSTKIVLRAANPNYKGDTIIDKATIKRLFSIKGKITRNQL